MYFLSVVFVTEITKLSNRILVICIYSMLLSIDIIFNGSYNSDSR